MVRFSCFETGLSALLSMTRSIGTHKEARHAEEARSAVSKHEELDRLLIDPPGW